MNQDARTQATIDCESLCHAAAAAADSADAEAFASLFVEDGVFHRLGHPIEGREAIRNVIASRPADVWTRHRYGNFRIEVADDARSAEGRFDLEMQRGRKGASDIEQIRAEHHDHFVLTEQGWRFASRKVVIKS